jgi:Zn-dependent metalloprotease
MTYDDGSGPLLGGFKPLTSLDVCAHEIGHGVATFTSNLVYAHESGAMNEAVSDIWAACVERFAIVSVDGSLINTYRPFYIGEQIAATPDDPLRRMDNPKAASDPDTYGGQFWRNPDCSPDILNDNCGVHTNSGVLNKWFYLITVGSHNGLGPDAAYARPDSDDGINDLGNNYSVTGLGFSISEQITYMTELLLTATATYAEAREVSLSVAGALSGDACSDMVATVANAWGMQQA